MEYIFRVTERGCYGGPQFDLIESKDLDNPIVKTKTVNWTPTKVVDLDAPAKMATLTGYSAGIQYGSKREPEISGYSFAGDPSEMVWFAGAIALLAELVG
jgi:hypothetical protein